MKYTKNFQKNRIGNNVSTPLFGKNNVVKKTVREKRTNDDGDFQKFNKEQFQKKYNNLKNNLKNPKYEIGIVILSYNRYFTTLSSLDSLLNCNISKTKIVIIDDNSPDIKIKPMLENFKKQIEKNNTNKVELILRNERWGKWSLGRNFCNGLEYLNDCEYIFFIPDDTIYNKYLFDVVRKSFEYFSDNIKAISFWHDNREVVFNILKNTKNYQKFNKDFHHINFTDGFLILFKRDFVYNNLNFYIDPDIAKSKNSTLVWSTISKCLKNFNIISYNETLAEHIGNDNSSMIGNIPRNPKRLIHAKNLNLWGKPKILC